MFGVALCGIDPVEWPQAASTPVVPLPEPSSESFLEHASYALARMQDDFGAVLVLHPAGSSPARRVRTARNLADAKRVLPLTVDLPPTAIAVLAGVVARLADLEVPAGAVVGGLAQVLASLTVVARTSSVAKLDAVDVRFGSHLRSLVPGTSFVVTVAPSPAVRTSLAAADLPADPRGHLLVTAGDAAYGATLLAALGAAPAPGAGAASPATRASAPHATTPASPGTLAIQHRAGSSHVSWWHARRVLEATRAPLDLSELAASLRDRPAARCSICGDVAVESECRFCSAMEVL